MAPHKNATRLQNHIEVELLNYIRRNSLNKGDRLPPQINLAQQLGVSAAALREALARLANQGVIRQVHGIGTFVAEDPYVVQYSALLNLSLSEMIRARGMQPGTENISLSHDIVPAEFSDFLQPAPSSRVLCVRRTRTADGMPFAFSISYFSPRLEGLSDEESAYSGSMYEYLQEHCGEIVAESDTIIEAQIASEEVQQRLNIESGAPVLAVIQSHRNNAGAALFASADYFMQKRLKMQVRRHRPAFVDRP